MTQSTNDRPMPVTVGEVIGRFRTGQADKIVNKRRLLSPRHKRHPDPRTETIADDR